MDESDWPGVGLFDIHVQPCARWSGLRDVEPVFTRQPYENWCRLFRWACEADDALDWKGAGFVRCAPAEIEAVRTRFEHITRSVNEEFRELLRKALISQPDAAREVIAIDGSLAASEDGVGYLCGFSSRI